MDKREYMEKVAEVAGECLALAKDTVVAPAVVEEAVDLSFDLADELVDLGPRVVIEHTDHDDAIFVSGHEDRLAEQDSVKAILEEIAFWAARSDVIAKINELHEADNKKYSFATRAGSVITIEGSGRVTIDMSENVRCFASVDEAVSEVKNWRAHSNSPEEHRDCRQILDVLYTFESQKMGQQKV